MEEGGGGGGETVRENGGGKARQKKKKDEAPEENVCVLQTEEVRSQRVNPAGNKEIDTEWSPSVSV